MIHIHPTRTWHRPAEPVTIAVQVDPPDLPVLAGAVLQVSSLDTVVQATPVESRHSVELGSFPLGGYGVDLTSPDGDVLASTAFDVLTSAFDRPRYGFLTSFGPDVAVDEVAHHYLRLHLNLAQYYDWAYRHTRLQPPPEVKEYLDALGNPVSVPMLRRLIATLREIGTANLGYAAVYAIEPDEKDEWAPHSLYRADGTTHALGEDFLFIADPSDPVWLDFLLPQLAQAHHDLGFDGFHLDQYGWPKFARRADGSVVDVGDAFVQLINRIAGAVPDAHLVFNNVNGFPLERTAQAQQAALYTEVWPPRTRLDDLADHIATSRAAARSAGRPPAGPSVGDTPLPTIVAAYLSTYDAADPRAADACAQLTMATIFSSGASHLLTGERAAVLTDPYYPRHHLADRITDTLLENWYSFLVRYGDLLLSPALEDVTGDTFGDYNGGITVTAPPGVPVSIHPEPGTLWVRVIRVGRDHVVHLINLTGQPDAAWDRPKNAIQPITGTILQVESSQPDVPQWHYASPDEPGPMRLLPVRPAGNNHVAELPPLGAWTMIRLPAPTTILDQPAETR